MKKFMKVYVALGLIVNCAILVGKLAGKRDIQQLKELSQDCDNKLIYCASVAVGILINIVLWPIEAIWGIFYTNFRGIDNIQKDLGLVDEADE